MIDTGAPIRTSYFDALDGLVSVTLPIVGVTIIPVFSIVPDGTAYPFILLEDQSDRGGDVETRTKDNKNATEHLFTIKIVSGFKTAVDHGSYKIVDDITTALLLLVLPATPLTFTGLENVTQSIESIDYERERNDTDLVITKIIVIRHLISQAS